MAAPKNGAKDLDTAVAVVPDRSRLNALVGTIEDRIRAFDQIAANLASLQLNGWDTVQKAKAACWLSDGAGMHPAIFMQNHYCMNMQGKLVVEPKWEFIVGILQSRVPGFRWKVLIETDDCAEVWMSDGRNEHTVQYSLNDAKRQGLLGRGGNAWTAGNTREMCLKQAIKRCGRRLSSAALMDLPVSEAYEAISEADGQPSPTEVIDKAIEKVVGKPQPTDVEFEEVEAPSGEPVPVEPTRSPRQHLYAVMTRYYGKLGKDQVAEKASLIYNQMMKDSTGTDPNVSFKRGEIGPVEAAQIATYLEAKMARGGAASSAAGTSELTGAPSSAASKVAPPTSSEEMPEPEVDQAPVPRTAADAYDELMSTVGRARKLFDRKFIQESPAGSSKFWFTDLTTFREAGDAQPIFLQRGQDIVASVEKIEQLNRILAATCDKQERGGR